MIREYQQEIDRLKAQLAAKGLGTDPTIITQIDLKGLDPELLKQIAGAQEEEIMKLLTEKGIVEEVR